MTLISSLENIWKILLFLSFMPPLCGRVTGIKGMLNFYSHPSSAHYILLYSLQQRRKQQLTLVLLPGKSHGQGSLMGYNP